MRAIVACAVGSAACGPSQSGEAPAGGTCAAPRSSVTEAGRHIVANEVWTADRSHHVIGTVYVSRGATLTIDPCTVVALGEGASIVVGGVNDHGRIAAMGSAEEPIVFRRKDAAPWKSIDVYAGSGGRLSHVVLSGGGQYLIDAAGWPEDPWPLPEPASLRLVRENAPGARGLTVTDVRIEDSLVTGVSLSRGARFADDSSNLTITGTGLQWPNHLAGIAVATAIEDAEWLPPSLVFEGNRFDAVALKNTRFGSDLPPTEVRLRDRGVAYVFLEDLALDAGAKVTVEAGARLLFASNAAVRINGLATGGRQPGTLVAEGTAEKPVVFAPATSAGWIGMEITSYGHASLVHTVIETGDVAVAGQRAPLLVGEHRYSYRSERPTLHLEHLLIRNSRAPCLRAAEMAFSEGSQDLAVEGCVSSTGLAYPVDLDVVALSTLPSTTLRGNTINAIPVSAAAGDMTFRGHQAAYRALKPLSVAAGQKWTFEAGARREYSPGTFLSVSGGSPAGALVAEGTAERPVIFTSAAAEPRPGDWGGLEFAAPLSPDSALRHARIEYTGEARWFSGSCASADGYRAAVWIRERPASALITDTVISHAAGVGILSHWKSDAEGPDFRLSSAFTDVAGCQQTLWRTTGDSCDAPGTTCLP